MNTRVNEKIVTSGPGVGKTALLVQIALDDLMRDRKVLHVSHVHAVDHVRAFYSEIFHDLSVSSRLVDPESVLLDDFAASGSLLLDAFAAPEPSKALCPVRCVTDAEDGALDCFGEPGLHVGGERFDALDARPAFLLQLQPLPELPGQVVGSFPQEVANKGR